MTINVDKADEQYGFPVNAAGLFSYLTTFSSETQDYFHQMALKAEAREFLKKYFIEIENKFMSKDLEEYNSLQELYEEVDAKAKIAEAKQNWFQKHLVTPFLTPFMSKMIGIDYHNLRKKQREQVSDAMFLLSIWLHLDN